MNTAIKKAKKTLAVFLCILLCSSFSVPFAGAEGTLKWEVNKDGYTATVPAKPDETVPLTLPNATLEGAEGEIEYSLVLMNGNEEKALSENALKYNFSFSKDKPEIVISNVAKEFVFLNSNEPGKITLGMRAVCGDIKSEICKIIIENCKVTATFSYLCDEDKYVDVQKEVYYGQSVENFAKEITDFKLPQNDNNCHYINNSWVDFYGETEIDRVTKDTTFVLSISSAPHEIDETGEDYEKVEATCTNDGSIKGRCKVCNYLVTQVISALGHDPYISKPAQNATCFEDGWTEEKTCNRCKEVIVPSEVKKALGQHTLVTDEAVEPTCTKTGLTEGSHCSACGEVIKAQEEVPVKDHQFVSMPEKPESCFDVGYKAGERCSVCGTPKTEDLIIPAIGHHTEVIDAAVDPTCTEKGKTEGKHCLVCGTITIAQEEKAALGHDKDEASIIKRLEPTCTTEGKTEGFYCKRCEKTFEPEIIPMLKHTEEIIEAVPATCTKTGLTEGKRCSVCKTVLVPQEETAALSHDLVTDIAGQDATCTEKGFTAKKHCTRCDYVEEQTEIEAKGHHLVSQYGKDATCTEDGLTDRVFCTRCNYVEKEQEVIPNLGGHIDSDNDGYCDRCGAVVEHEPVNTCDHMCHKDGFVGWLWKYIICPLCKLFGVEQRCKCGEKHW